ncbi:MAG: hypothetical protein PF489_00425 [Salinivirgaceae bacterium]|jgi:hypothetical protein|nr:hypothetical protein [Salinivirgaceae bacterium]
MKKLIIAILITVEATLLLGSDDPSCKIIFFRENKNYGTVKSFDIQVNDSTIITMWNNTRYEYECTPGAYVYGVDGEKQGKVNVEEGNTYYVKLGLVMHPRPVKGRLLLVDSSSVKQMVNFQKTKELHGAPDDLIRPKNKLGVELNLGIGMSSVPLITMEGGGESNLSFGGVSSFTFSFSHQVNHYFDLSASFSFGLSSLNPPLQNATVEYTRRAFLITPSYIIPINGGYKMRFLFGAGVGYYSRNKLEINTSEIVDGLDDTWYYENAFAPHVRLTFEVNLYDNWVLAYGASYYDAQLSFDYSNKKTYPAKEEMETADGSAINLIMGMYYNF